MDETKDTSANVFPKILDSLVQTNPFGKNRSGERAYRRAERLAAAIFLLTNHVSEQESVRSDLRRLSCNLLEHILVSRDEMRALASSPISDLQRDIRRIISLIRMLVFSGHVSMQNAEVVIYAADELGAFIAAAARSPLSETILFSKEELIAVPDNYKIQYKGQKDIRDRIIIKDTERTSATPASVPQSGSKNLSARENGIIGILRSGGDLNIRDIAAHLPEYGEKTIQRELNHLIEQGLVKRTGLKRWSRYSLTER